MSRFYEDQGGPKFWAEILKLVKRPKQGSQVILDLFLNHGADYDHKMQLNAVLPRALLACGEEGLASLTTVLYDNDTKHGKVVGAIEALWVVQSDHPRAKATFWEVPAELKLTPPASVREGARAALRGFLAESMTDSIKSLF